MHKRRILSEANDLSLTRVNFKTNFRKINVSVNPLTFAEPNAPNLATAKIRGRSFDSCFSGLDVVYLCTKLYGYLMSTNAIQFTSCVTVIAKVIVLLIYCEMERLIE